MCGAGTACDAIVGQFPLLFGGYLVTLRLVAVTTIPSIAIAIMLALGRISRHRFVRALSIGYIELFRGLPMLILLVLLYYGLGKELHAWHISAFWVAAVGLTVNESAYAAGPYHSCLLSIGVRQWDATASLGFKRFEAIRYVILPQATLSGLAPTANLVIHLAKGSALASLITVAELVQSVQNAISNTYVVLPMYLTVALFFLALTVPLTYITKYLERRVHRMTGARTLV